MAMQQVYYIEHPVTGEYLGSLDEWVDDMDEALFFTDYDECVEKADEVDGLVFEAMRHR